MILNFEKFNLLEKFNSSILRDLNDKFKKQTGKDLYSTMKRASISLDKVTDEDIRKGRGKLSNYRSKDHDVSKLTIQIGMEGDNILWVYDTGSNVELLGRHHEVGDGGRYSGVHTNFNDGKREDYSDKVCDIYEITYESNYDKSAERSKTDKRSKERIESDMREENLDFKKISSMVKKDEARYDRRYSRVNDLFRGQPNNEEEFLKFMNDHLEPTFKSYDDVKRMFGQWNIQMKETWFRDKQNLSLNPKCSIYQWLYVMPKMAKFFK